MTQVIRGGIITVSVLSAAQAHSKDGKGRNALQGFLSRTTEGRGKKQKTVVHEFSVLREIKPDKPLKAGRYAFDGVLVLNVDDAPHKTHEVKGVTYAKHNARIIGGQVKSFEPLPDDIEFGAMPF